MATRQRHDPRRHREAFAAVVRRLPGRVGRLLLYGHESHRRNDYRKRGRPLGHRTELSRRERSAWCRTAAGPQRVVQCGVLEPVPVAAHARGDLVVAACGHDSPATIGPTLGRPITPTESRRPLQNPEKTGAARIIFGASPPSTHETKNPIPFKSVVLASHAYRVRNRPPCFQQRFQF